MSILAFSNFMTTQTPIRRATTPRRSSFAPEVESLMMLAASAMIRQRHITTFKHGYALLVREIHNHSGAAGMPLRCPSYATFCRRMRSLYPTVDESRDIRAFNSLKGSTLSKGGAA